MASTEITSTLSRAIEAVPPGAWAVGVSGGADSVALLQLLIQRADLTLHIAHLDHETRAGGSGEDATFVARLAKMHGVACSIAKRSEIERGVERLPQNRSARFRAVRLELFRRVVEDHRLLGVLLAHHADDQAETIVQRLLRGSGVAGLAGMSAELHISGLRVVRPLLAVRSTVLRAWLHERGMTWREDLSNQSPDQQRNRVRAMLAGHDEIASAALRMGASCASLSAWLREAGAVLSGAEVELEDVRRLPPPIARAAARHWLAERAGAGVEIPPSAVERLLLMANDAASPARQQFPGRVLVRRRKGRLITEPLGPLRGRSSLNSPRS